MREGHHCSKTVVPQLLPRRTLEVFSFRKTPFTSSDGGTFPFARVHPFGTVTLFLLLPESFEGKRIIFFLKKVEVGIGREKKKKKDFHFRNCYKAQMMTSLS
jgi:hypothetical protein